MIPTSRHDHSPDAGSQPEVISTSPLRALVETITAESRLPSVKADRCVHDRIGHASCRACADACPRAAWIIDDERLGIDTSACDGCGLCVPACPEGAISINPKSASAGIRSWKDHPAVFRACERTDLAAPDSWIPCLHATGIRELLGLYRRGVATWIISTADCDACPRGRARRLPESVEQTNALLQSRGLQPIVLAALKSQRWLEILGQSTPYQGQPIWSRRNFFRGALRTAVNTALDPTALVEEEQANFTPPAAWLPNAGPADLFLFSPAIDPLRCNGCNACVRLCPHQAITLETTQGEPCYRIEAQQCTGCGICRDACDQAAIHIDTSRPRLQAMVPLVQASCPACGVSYHLPAGQRRSDKLCPICARTRHGRHLYQVLK